MDSRRGDPSHVAFDFTQHVRYVCADVVSRLTEFSHVDLDRVAIRFCQTRRAGRFGVQASLTPLRFEGGCLETRRRGRRYTIQRIFGQGDCEQLYLLSFYLPRFLDLPFEEKLATICHELWHIGPDFDGDLRRHDGRCYAHGRSEERFHAAMRDLAQRYLATSPVPQVCDFLRLSFRELQTRHGRIIGVRLASPKLIRLAEGEPLPEIRRSSCA